MAKERTLSCTPDLLGGMPNLPPYQPSSPSSGRERKETENKKVGHVKIQKSYGKETQQLQRQLLPPWLVPQ